MTRERYIHGVDPQAGHLIRIADWSAPSMTRLPILGTGEIQFVLPNKEIGQLLVTYQNIESISSSILRKKNQVGQSNKTETLPQQEE